ncbi:MAG TPA: ankyrin repeat domain-containing protein [Bryobacteraceae bacterium]
MSLRNLGGRTLVRAALQRRSVQLAILCAAALGALAWMQGIRAQAQQAPQAKPAPQAKNAPPDLATLVQAGDTKQALAQIQAGADVNRAQPDGTTPLIWAVYRKDYEVAQALIAKKANVNVTNEFGGTPLTEAARQSDGRLVKILLDAGARADSANADGETALMVAISGGDLSVVQMLVNAGANVNTIEKFHNQTPLMYAAAANRNAAQMVKLLLSKDADVRPRALFSDWPSQVTSEPRAQYRSVGGLTALLYATRSGCYDCVEGLIAAGADVNAPTPEGITPLMIALDNEHNDIAKLFMDKGANLEVWDWWGRTALWIAVDRKTPPAGAGTAGFSGFGGGGGARGGGGRGAQGNGGRGGPGVENLRDGGGARANARPPVSSMEIINKLLEAGVNPNPIMNFHRPNAPGRGRFGDNEISTGTTALFRAVQNQDVEVVKALLEKGADPNINTMGYSPLLLAAGAGPRGRGAANQPNMQVLDALVQHSADINAKVTGTNTYSFNVSRENMGNKEAFSQEGTSALHEAARAARPDLVKYLLDHGADANLLDAEGKKPIDIIAVQRVARGGNAINVRAGQSGGAAPGGGRGAGGRGGNSEAATQIRALLEAAAAKR